jgi:hypothetical protein
VEFEDETGRDGVCERLTVAASVRLCFLFFSSLVSCVSKSDSTSPMETEVDLLEIAATAES